MNRFTVVMLVLVGLVAGVVIFLAGVPVWVAVPIALVAGFAIWMDERNIRREAALKRLEGLREERDG